MAAVLSAVGLVLGVVLLVGGGLVVTADATVRDDGFMMSDGAAWNSPGCAVRSENVQLNHGRMGLDFPHRMMGRFRATVDPTGPAGVFIGIGAAADIDRYLHHVAHSTISDPYESSTTSRFSRGGSPRVEPASADIWVASATGTGPQQITWDPRPGSWTLVVMNADGTTPVAADVAVGTEASGLRTAGWALVVTGLTLLGAASTGLLLSLRRT